MMNIRPALAVQLGGATLFLLLAIAALATFAMTSGVRQAHATGPAGQARIAENSPGGSQVGTPLQAQAPAGSPVRYSLSGPDAGSFTIDPDTGEINLAQGVSPDFESQAAYRDRHRRPDRERPELGRARNGGPLHQRSESGRGNHRRPIRPGRRNRRPHLVLGQGERRRRCRHPRSHGAVLHPHRDGHRAPAAGHRLL